MATKAKYDHKHCTGCNRNRTLPYFYNAKPSKFNPDGKVSICKDCLRSMVDPDDVTTVIKVLRQIDKPFIQDIWEQSLASKNNALGDYLRKINSLRQYRELGFDDIANVKHSSFQKQEPEPDPLVELHREMTKPQSLKNMEAKWGTGFTETEYTKLEEKEADYKRSYEINAANHKDLLHQICKLNILCDRTILRDPDAYKKYSDMLDKLSRSAKFTEAQRTEADKTGGINTFGQMVELIEKEGFIPRWHTDEPMDIVDHTINVINEFTKRLVMGEPNIANLVDMQMSKMNLGVPDPDEMDEDEEIDESELDRDFEFDDLNYKTIEDDE